MNEFEKARSLINRALRSKDKDALRDASFKFEYLLWHGFKPHLFSFLLRTLSKSACLRMQGASYLLNIFQSQWRRLSRDQSSLLLEFIQSYFADFKDRMAWFTISEILGEQFRDENAYSALCILRSTKQFEPRSFVPHGFEHIIRESGNILLSRAALDQLCEMTKDKSKYVRYEAEVSLARVKNHFVLGTPFKNKSAFELVAEFRTSWTYEWEVKRAKRMWEEYRVDRPFSDRYFSTVGWKTSCCAFKVDVNFKFYELYPNNSTMPFLQQPQISWLRSKWEPLDRRIGIPCGKCGRRRRPNWGYLIMRARANAKALPSYSK